MVDWTQGRRQREGARGPCPVLRRKIKNKVKTRKYKTNWPEPKNSGPNPRSFPFLLGEHWADARLAPSWTIAYSASEINGNSKASSTVKVGTPHDLHAPCSELEVAGTTEIVWSRSRSWSRRRSRSQNASSGPGSTTEQRKILRNQGIWSRSLNRSRKYRNWTTS